MDWVSSAAPPFDTAGRRLHEYLDWLARETGWQIRLPTDARGVEETTLYAGVAHPDESFKNVLGSCNLKSTLSDGVLYLEHVEPASTPPGS